MKRGVLLLLPVGVAFAQQSALDPAGPYAHRIELLGAFFLGLLGLIFLVVIILALLSLTRRHRGIDQEPLEQNHRPSESTERRLTRTVGIAAAVTVLILLGLVVISVSAGKATSTPGNPDPANALVIEITGTQ
ncbi:MAG TPA: hypothetical protein VK604_17210, partial [Bryobacteraceae bacterium]|nr:hypothetical protein [Bryobacteraceae bacterium]